MIYLKRFLEHNQHPTIWEVDWHTIAPDKLVVIKGDSTDINGYVKAKKDQAGNLYADNQGEVTDIKCEYKLDEIMSNLVYQICYERDFDVLGISDNVEIDIDVAKNENSQHFVIQVEISFGDLIVSGFTIEAPNKVKVYQYTSYKSKTDPSNTVFAFDEDSLQKLISFFNKFDGIKVEREQFNFLDSNPNNYNPNADEPN